ncbi:MAG TPA: cupredoxin domain-containing protein [Mycobacteriales bacterium]|jgi:plastocyanin
MPDPTTLTDLLRERAAAAPDPRPLTDAFVRRVCRRRAARLTLAGAGAAAGVAAVLAVVAAVAAPAPQRTAVRPAAPSPSADSRYEFCDMPATARLHVMPFGRELKYDRGCYVAQAGVPVTLTFANSGDVAHNVVVRPEGGEPFAKTETLVSGERTIDTIELGRLAKGDYTLTCDLHPGMYAQLVAR